MKRLYQAANLAEAHLVAGMLAAAAIETRILNENAQGATGELPFTHTWPEIWLVDANDEARARAVIGQYEKTTANAGTKVCGRCGENSPATFECCWHCGAELDDAFDQGDPE